MMTLTLLIIATAALFGGIILVRSIPALSAYFTFRGKRLVTCPETHRIEGVDLAAGKAGSHCIS